MKKTDIIFILFFILLFSPFFIFKPVLDFYSDFNKEHGMVMSFIKFFFLAPIGEILGLRIKTGNYFQKGFGLLPRAIVWGFLGITIQMAFQIFAAGTPKLLEFMGVQGAADSMKSGITGLRILTAFSISVLMNLFYAPVMMTFHKITDTHILNNGGTLKGFLTPVNFGENFSSINWNVQWDFVFKKTIPFFWIPAQTINFLLPAEYRILVAAIYGIILGVLLSIASLKQRK
ncbi:MAG: Mpv17/PMP22 family protein [Bacteroidales bacterium]|nr:Mpv17/PMP22 family protein [Bacteroidales bacterium]